MRIQVGEPNRYFCNCGTEIDLNTAMTSSSALCKKCEVKKANEEAVVRVLNDVFLSSL